MPSGADALFSSQGRRKVRVGDLVILRIDGFPKDQCEVTGDGFLEECMFVASQSRDAGSYGSLFEVYPRMVTQASRRLRKALRKRNMTEAELNANIRQGKTIEPSLMKSFQEANSEKDQNAFEYKRFLGKPVLFGETIQLRHVRSGKFMCFERQVSLFDSTCEKMALASSAGDGTWLQVQPRFKVQNEGSTVFYSDSVFVESVKMPQTFLHCSNHDFGHPTFGTIQEVNGFSSSTPVKFAASRSFQATAKNLRAYDLVTIVHRDLEMPISLKSKAKQLSSSWSQDQYTSQSSLLTIQNTQIGLFGPGCIDSDSQTDSQNAGRALTQVQSPDDVWQFELEDPCVSSRISYGQTLLIKHAGHRKYLACQQDSHLGSSGQIFLSNKRSASSFWELTHPSGPLPASYGSEFVQSNARVLICHKVTGLILCANRSSGFANTNATTSPLANFDMLELGVSREPDQQHAIAVLPLPVSCTHIFEFGHMLKLGFISATGKLSEVHNITVADVRSVRKAIDMCHDSLKQSENSNTGMESSVLQIESDSMLSGVEIPDGQLNSFFKKAMFITGVTACLCDLTYELYRAASYIESDMDHKKGAEEDASASEQSKALHSIVLKCICAAHQTLVELSDGDDLIGKSVACLVPFLQHRVHLHDLSDTLLDSLFKSNRELLFAVDEKVVEFFVHQLEHQHQEPDLYLNFLANLLVVDGEGISTSQKHVLNHLFMNTSRKHLLIESSVNHGTVRVRRHGGDTDADSCWQELEGVLQSSAAEHRHVVSMMELYANMCVGALPEIVNAIQPLVPLDVCLSLMNDPNVPADCRTQAGNILLNLYIRSVSAANSDEKSWKSSSRTCFVWSDLEKDQFLPSLFVQEPPPSMLSALPSIVAFLSQNGRFEALSDPVQGFHRNQLILCSIRIIMAMFKRGFILSERDVLDISGYLTQLLDHEVPSPPSSSTQMSQKAYQIVIETKIAIVKLLDAMADARTSLCVPRLLSVYKRDLAIQPSRYSSKRGMLPTTDGISEPRTDLVKEKNANHSSRPELNTLLRFMDINQGDRLSLALRKLIKGSSKELSTCSLLLIVRLKTITSELRRKIKEVHLIVAPDAVEGYDEILDCFAVLNKYKTSLFTLLENPLSSNELATVDKQNVFQSFSKIVELCTNTGARELNVTLSNREAAIRVQGIQLIVEIVQHAVKCDKGLVTQEAKSSIMSNSWIKDCVISECFRIFCVTCENFTPCQAIVVHALKDVCHFFNSGVDCASVLVNVFHNNASLKAGLQEDLVAIMCKSLNAARDPAGPPIAEPANIVRCLILLCTVDGCPLQANQSMILKHLCANHEYTMQMFENAESRRLRSNLLEQNPDWAEDNSSPLALFVHSLQLFSSLCEGTPSHSARLRKHLHPKVLSEDVCDKSLPAEMRSAVLSTFLAVCVSVDDVFASGVEEAISTMLDFFLSELASVPLSPNGAFKQADSLGDVFATSMSDSWLPLINRVLSQDDASGAAVSSSSSSSLGLGNSLVSDFKQLPKILSQLVLIASDPECPTALFSALATTSKLATTAGIAASAINPTQMQAQLESPSSPEDKNTAPSHSAMVYVQEVLHRTKSEKLLDFASAAHSSDKYGDSTLDVQQDLPNFADEFHDCVNNKQLVNQVTTRESFKSLAAIILSEQNRLQSADCLSVINAVDTLQYSLQFSSAWHGASGYQGEREVVLIYILHILRLCPTKAIIDSAQSIVPLIVQLWDSNSHPLVMKSSIEFTCHFLQAGGSKIQNEFLQHLRKSNRSVTVFTAFAKSLKAGMQEAKVLRLAWSCIDSIAKHCPSEVSLKAIVDDWHHSHSVTQMESLIRASGPDQRKAEILNEATGSGVWQLLRMLQLFCEGHHFGFQTFLSQQSGSSHSIDLVSLTVEYMMSALWQLNPLLIDPIRQSLISIAEYIQNPCRQNQRVLINTKLCIAVNDILKYQSVPLPGYQDGDQYAQKLATLKSDAIVAVLSLLEGVDSSDIPNHVLSVMEPNIMLQNLNGLSEVYLKEVETKKKATLKDTTPSLFASLAHGDSHDEDEAQDLSMSSEAAKSAALYSFIIIKTLETFDHTGSWKGAFTRQSIIDYDSLTASVGSIEVSRNRNLEKVYFVIPKICRKLPKVSRERIVYSVDRTNPQLQLKQFFSQCCQQYEDLNRTQLLNQNQFTRLLQRKSALLDSVFFANALLINLLMLLFFENTDNENFLRSGIRLPEGARAAVIFFMAIHAILCAVRLSWAVIDRGFGRLEPIRLKQSKAIKHQTPGSKSTIWIPPILRLLLSLASQRDVMWSAVCFITCLAGFSGNASPLWLVVHLFEMFKQSLVLQNVLKSITYRGRTLLTTAVLGLVMFYIFGAVGFVAFPELFQFSEADIVDGNKANPNNNGAFCDSVWKCSLVALDVGLRTGDLGEAMDDIEWGIDKGEYRILIRMLYTFVFFVIVTTILMNIIFGIIIDTFAELREKKDFIDKDVQGRCFICRIERFSFESAGNSSDSFARHIREDHNMWNYLAFLVYLRDRDVDDLSGAESYVFDKVYKQVFDSSLRRKATIPLKQPDLSWFPQRQAIALNAGEKEADPVTQAIETVQQSTDHVVEKLAECKKAAATIPAAGGSGVLVSISEEPLESAKGTPSMRNRR